jgi:hypothetical protein
VLQFSHAKRYWSAERVDYLLSGELSPGARAICPPPCSHPSSLISGVGMRPIKISLPGSVTATRSVGGGGSVSVPSRERWGASLLASRLGDYEEIPARQD